MTLKKAIAVTLVPALLVSITACGQPQVSPENLRLTASLRTALSARNPDWLEQNLALVEQRRAEGKMTDAEHEAFLEIIQKAQAGRWQEAEDQAIALQKAQRPVRGEVVGAAEHAH